MKKENVYHIFVFEVLVLWREFRAVRQGQNHAIKKIKYRGGLNRILVAIPWIMFKLNEKVRSYYWSWIILPSHLIRTLSGLESLILYNILPDGGGLGVEDERAAYQLTFSIPGLAFGNYNCNNVVESRPSQTPVGMWTLITLKE